jgi:hypothetical protein
LHYVGFEVLTAVVVESTIFWDTFHAGITLSLFDPEDGVDIFLRNVG